MREIKFRAWDKKKKEWFIIGHNPLWVNPPIHEEYETLEVMQYTGLHDKHGKEIYEGDILGDNAPCLSITEMHEGHFGWKEVGGGARGIFPFDCEYGELSVIGNIYENPELLK